jgi:hypothetical protein
MFAPNRSAHSLIKSVSGFSRASSTSRAVLRASSSAASSLSELQLRGEIDGMERAR